LNRSPLPRPIGHRQRLHRRNSGTCGVAVGLGLMSWVLPTDGESDAVPVMAMANGEEALELIFSPKEVRFFVLVVSNSFIMLVIMSFFRLKKILR
jgi:hypothetical protein